MRTIRYILFFTPVFLLLFGCDKSLLREEYPVGDFMPSYTYLLSISFKNNSGDDLVSPLAEEQWKPTTDYSNWAGEINPDRYNLKVILSNPHESWDNSIYNFKAHDGFIPTAHTPSLQIVKYYEDYPLFKEKYGEVDGCNWLLSNFHSPGINGLQNSLTYRITCPTIFGDNSAHEIIAYWEKDPGMTYDAENSLTWSQYPECTKAIFDGDEVHIMKYVFAKTEFREYYTYFLDIVINE